jgi:hypothetical protein
MKKLTLLPLLLIIFAVSCDDDDPVSNSLSTEVSVLSMNLYAGGDFTVLNSVISIEQLTETTQDIWVDALANNDNRRFDAIADLIEDKSPDVILLQDVATWYEQSPGDFLSGDYTLNATDLVFDNLLDLMDNMTATYEIADRVVTSDWEFPRRVGVQANSTDVRIVLENVVLVKSGVTVESVSTSKQFTNNDQFTIDNYELNLTNGFQVVELMKGAVGFTVANGKLIGSDYAAKQLNQTAEILNALPDSRPVIAGFNVNNTPGSNSVQNIINSNYADAWSTVRGNANGFTCCISSDLRDASGLSQRTSYQFYSTGDVEARNIELIGDDATERIEDNTEEYLSNEYGLFGRYRVVVPG